jgi:GNAT superfamily N-acetyltransferase
MEIIDLEPENEKLYFVCLEDWSGEMKEAGSHKENWFNKMKDKGLRVKLAKDDSGKIGGMIQYLPIENSFVNGEDLYFITCTWVHGYKQGRGNFQKKGMGKALLKAAEEDAKSLGAKGIAAWGVSLPFWMKASWYKKQGYLVADKLDIAILVWKPFSDSAKAPSWIKETKPPKKEPGKVIVTSFLNGWCPAQNIIHERAKRASGEFEGKVEFKMVDTSDRNDLLKYGIADALFIDNKEVNTGPPPSYKKIKKLIKKKVKKLK